MSYAMHIVCVAVVVAPASGVAVVDVADVVDVVWVLLLTLLLWLLCVLTLVRSSSETPEAGTMDARRSSVIIPAKIWTATAIPKLKSAFCAFHVVASFCFFDFGFTFWARREQVREGWVGVTGAVIICFIKQVSAKSTKLGLAFRTGNLAFQRTADQVSAPRILAVAPSLSQRPNFGLQSFEGVIHGFSCKVGCGSLGEEGHLMARNGAWDGDASSVGNYVLRFDLRSEIYLRTWDAHDAITPRPSQHRARFIRLIHTGQTFVSAIFDVHWQRRLATF